MITNDVVRVKPDTATRSAFISPVEMELWSDTDVTSRNFEVALQLRISGNHLQSFLFY